MGKKHTATMICQDLYLPLFVNSLHFGHERFAITILFKFPTRKAFRLRLVFKMVAELH